MQGVTQTEKGVSRGYESLKITNLTFRTLLFRVLATQTPFYYYIIYKYILYIYTLVVVEKGLSKSSPLLSCKGLYGTTHCLF